MSTFGTEGPVLWWEGLEHYLGSPEAGGRNETYEPVEETFENIFGEEFIKERKFRFIGLYKFLNKDPSLVEDMLEIHNNSRGRPVHWQRYRDGNIIHLCNLKTVRAFPSGGHDLINDSLEIEVRSKNLLSKQPGGDTDYAVFFPEWIISNQEPSKITRDLQSHYASPPVRGPQ